MRRFFPTLRGRMLTVIALIICAMTAILGFVQYKIEYSNGFESLNRRIGELQERMTVSLPKALWDLDDAMIQRLIASEMRAPFVSGIYIRNKSGKILAGMARSQNGEIVKSLEPGVAADQMVEQDIVFSDAGKKEVLGVLQIQISHAELRQWLHSEILHLALGQTLFGLTLVAALGLTLTRLVLVPLEHVRTAIEEIGSGEANLQKRLPAGSIAEFAAIAEGFNRFIARLSGIMADVQLRCGSVASGAAEIKAGNEHLAQRTEQEATAAQQSASAVTQLARSIEVSREAAIKMREMAGDADSLGAKSIEAMGTVVQIIGDIDQSSRKITDIIAVIDGIAFQTKILALNASVEAARAGEQGRGFAVVAGEVQTLASRTSIAAREIKMLITASVEKVDEGQRRVALAGTSIDAMVSSVNRVTTMIDDIASASEQQKNQIGVIDHAIKLVDKTVQMNSALVEQVAAATGTMNESTLRLVELVDAFKVGDDHARAPRMNSSEVDAALA